MGSLCGLGFDFTSKRLLANLNLQTLIGYFRRHRMLLGGWIWEQVGRLGRDWDLTNQTAARAIFGMCWGGDDNVGRKKEDFKVS